MPFNNRLIETIPTVDITERVAFHTLQEGERYTHTPEGHVSQVIEVKPVFRTIRRYDDWLIHCKAGCFLWDKMVIKVTPLRK
ncbi:hypothetical protein SAMN05421821_105173 [Mucilaginibacter lappiensis]|uniref:Uncharacterized protein n=1 Tax=Mucilaginibacter lappiensis TaxID=354630 RepID=A0ABR6PL70_9SPHI|nr:hypothetical protein [Mucilaginibacter lappiensis]MBB6109755.1 hypothetical protein [Mucilaginibacter lappiensis]SIR14428.1 hypothetical protein SAMN05421821_105173 [Mucilaginibacter lappiensis]